MQQVTTNSNHSIQIPGSKEIASMRVVQSCGCGSPKLYVRYKGETQYVPLKICAAPSSPGLNNRYVDVFSDQTVNGVKSFADYIRVSSSYIKGGATQIFGNTAGGGLFNVLIGTGAGNAMTGQKNIMIGDNACVEARAINNTIAIGIQSGPATNYLGDNNFFLGYKAGYNMTGGSGNVHIGQGSGISGTYSNRLFIGNPGEPTTLESAHIITGYFDTGVLRFPKGYANTDASKFLTTGSDGTLVLSAPKMPTDYISNNPVNTLPRDSTTAHNIVNANLIAQSATYWNATTNTNVPTSFGGGGGTTILSPDGTAGGQILVGVHGDLWFRGLSGSAWTNWNTAENQGNKINNFNSPNSSTYPTTQAVMNNFVNCYSVGNLDLYAITGTSEMWSGSITNAPSGNRGITKVFTFGGDNYNFKQYIRDNAQDSWFYNLKTNGNELPWYQVASREWVNSKGFLNSIPSLQQVTAVGNTTNVGGANGGTTSITGNGLTLIPVTNGASWSRGLWYNDTSGNNIGGFGAYGVGQGLSFLYLQSATTTAPYSNPDVKIVGNRVGINLPTGVSNLPSSNLDVRGNVAIVGPDATTAPILNINTNIAGAGLTIGNNQGTAGQYNTRITALSTNAASGLTFNVHNQTTGFSAGAYIYNIFGADGSSAATTGVHSVWRNPATPIMSLTYNGVLTLPTLAGTGTRVVTSDPSGNLYADNSSSYVRKYVTSDMFAALPGSSVDFQGSVVESSSSASNLPPGESNFTGINLMPNHNPNYRSIIGVAPSNKLYVANNHSTGNVWSYRRILTEGDNNGLLANGAGYITTETDPIYTADKGHLLRTDLTATNTVFGSNTLDVNTITNNSIVRVSNGANSPNSPFGNGSGGTILTSIYSVNNYATQLALGFDGNAYVRGQGSPTAGTYSSWKHLLGTGDNISLFNNDAGYITSASLPTDYITTDTTQTGLTGDKTSSGTWFFALKTNTWYLDDAGAQRIHISSTNANGIIFKNTQGNQSFQFRNPTNATLFNISNSNINSILPTTVDIGTSASISPILKVAQNGGNISILNGTAASGVFSPTIQGVTNGNSIGTLLKGTGSDTYSVGAVVIQAGNAANNAGITSTNVFTIRNWATTLLSIDYAGVTKINNLAGSGTRMVTADANGNLSTQAITAGTVTSVGMTVGGAALNVTPATIASAGTFALTWAGNVNQYVNGLGNLVTFPTIPTVNNGILTLNTTGIATGGGGQPFTANQSGNTTFTVNVPGTNITASLNATTHVLSINSSTGTGATVDLTPLVDGQLLSSGGGWQLKNQGTGKQTVGTNALDFIVYDSAYTGNIGVTGEASVAFGKGNFVSGDRSASFGSENTSTGSRSFSLGLSSDAIGDGSFAHGQGTTVNGAWAAGFGISHVDGNYAFAAGNGNYAPSYSEVSVGIWGTNYTPASATAVNANDRIFNIGNGTSSAARKDALTVYKSGIVKISALAGSGSRMVTADANGNLSTQAITAGTVTSVGMTVGGAALNVTPASIASAGTFALTWAGTNAQYVNGQGNLVTFPAIPAGTVTSITTGNGLTGTSPITSTGTIALGTPGSITLSSANSVTAGSHTHAFVPGGTTSQYIRGDGSLAAMPSVPAVGNGTLTIQQNGSTVGTFTANQSANTTINLTGGSNEVVGNGYGYGRSNNFGSGWDATGGFAANSIYITTNTPYPVSENDYTVYLFASGASVILPDPKDYPNRMIRLINATKTEIKAPQQYAIIDYDGNSLVNMGTGSYLIQSIRGAGGAWLWYLVGGNS